MYNKKALLFDMEVGYQSELNWNCAVVQQYVPSIAKLKTSLIIPCQLGSFPLPGVHGGLCNPSYCYCGI